METSEESSTTDDSAEMARLVSIIKSGTGYFCCMLVNEGEDQKSKTILKVTKKPLKSLRRINQNDEKKKNFSVWSLEFIVAGFINRQDARAFRELWRLNCRGVDTRKNKGRHLAMSYGLIYCDAEPERFYVEYINKQNSDYIHDQQI